MTTATLGAWLKYFIEYRKVDVSSKGIKVWHHVLPHWWYHVWCLKIWWCLKIFLLSNRNSGGEWNPAVAKQVKVPASGQVIRLTHLVWSRLIWKILTCTKLPLHSHSNPQLPAIELYLNSFLLFCSHIKCYKQQLHFWSFDLMLYKMIRLHFAAYINMSASIKQSGRSAWKVYGDL